MPLSSEDLSLIDAYQAGRAVLSEDVLIKLTQVAHALGPAFGQCSERVFHKTDLPMGGEPDGYGRSIAALMAKHGMRLPAASYTTSIEAAKRHKLSKASEIENTFGVIFEIPSERISSRVIINLDRIYCLGLIDSSLHDYHETEFALGIRNVGNREREVIIGPTIVTVNDVCAIRGPTQSMLDYATALGEVFEEPETADEKSVELYERLERANLINEHAAWTCGSRARKVLRAALVKTFKKGINTSGLISPEEIAAGDDGGLDVIPLRHL